MDDKTRSLIERSISSNHIRWQHLLLEHKLKTINFREFEFAFEDPQPDYWSLYQQLAKVENSTKVDDYLYNTVPMPVFTKYNMEWSKQSIKEAEDHIQTFYSQESICEVLQSLEEIKSQSEFMKGEKASETIEWFKRFSNDILHKASSDKIESKSKEDKKRIEQSLEGQGDEQDNTKTETKKKRKKMEKKQA